MIVAAIALRPLAVEPVRDPVALAQRDETACATNWEQLNPTNPALPEPTLVARDGERWVKLFAEPEFLSVCTRARVGEINLFGTALVPARPGKITFQDGLEAALKADVLLGNVPAGTTSVQAKLRNGQVVAGATDGTYFVVFAPGQDLVGATVTASGPNGVLDSAVAPAE
jgi:hypothetical protein